MRAIISGMVWGVAVGVFWLGTIFAYNASANFAIFQTKGYVGPGDIIPNASAWWGLRCYTNAYTSNVADIWDGATGNTTETLIKCAKGGQLVATVNPLALTCAMSCVVATLYDQSGNGQNATQATNANRPAFTLNCLNGLPCMTFVGGNQTNLATASQTPIAPPWTYSAVMLRSGFTDHYTYGISTYDGTSSNDSSFGFPNVANQIDATCGNHIANSANDNAWHAAQFVCNGASGAINIDGTDMTAQNFGTNSIAAVRYIGGDGVEEFLEGKMVEIAAYSFALSPTQRTAMCHNQFAYWGTSVSC